MGQYDSIVPPEIFTNEVEELGKLVTYPRDLMHQLIHTARVLIVPFFAFLLLVPSVAGACPKQVVQAPIRTDDPDLSRWLLEQARQHVIESLYPGCDPFIDFEKTVDLFDYIGLGFFFSQEPSTLSFKRIQFFYESQQFELMMYATLHNEKSIAHNDIQACKSKISVGARIDVCDKRCER